ncbi:hypothetical protein [Klenkia sp. PcliD-1-E]|uniref:hypothetical protein n=1 Tax=Klenkia sp. PcliD-1-E TaxID=2954492 RepID=UPI00209756C8|nr:hypothetical protein [Klenkia sp. PcliD-1-E]MCO7218486.1 hypothetical protein [Klenkia sp. PcliD-1-E]
MRLVASSQAGAVERFEAIDLLEQRTVLATAVVRELQKSGGEDIYGRPTAALNLLRRWVGERYEAKVETHAKDGLASMVVPEGYEETMAELKDATDICEALAMAWTADTRRELDGDLAEIRSLVASYAW